MLLRRNGMGQKAVVTNRYLFDATDPSPVALPNELEILKEESGDYLIVVLNGNNQVEKIDLETGEIIWKTNVGVAPYGLVATKGKLFVTNWGGQIPDESDTDVAGVPWGKDKNKSGKTDQHVKVRLLFSIRLPEMFLGKL